MPLSKLDQMPAPGAWRSAVVVLLVTLASVAVATADARRGGEGTFAIGWTHTDIGPLADTLEPLGYERFSAEALSLGGSGRSFFGQLVIGGQGHALLTRARDANLLAGPFRTRMHQGYGFFDIGYTALQRGALELTPLLGIGGGATQLTIADRSSVPFGDVVSDPRRSSTLLRSAFLLDLGATLTRFFALEDGVRGRHGLVAGIRAGYVVSLAEGEWRDGDAELVGGPDTALAGPYVRFQFGGRVER